jgi:biopolymer transport protein ExbD
MRQFSEGKVYDDNELLSMINIAIKDASKYSIILTSKDDVTYQRFLNIISYLKNNEINNVSIGLKKMKLKLEKKREYDDDGLLPLVNIIFLLLIFFMIAGVIEKRIVKDDLELPAAELNRFENKEVTKIFINKDNIFFLMMKVQYNENNAYIKEIK